ncbi:MAG: hypothetical protein Q8L78_03235 [Coxiellaceae bacterium]|nr:hypothetical protein [Coxiellaceae bacterium]
MKKTLFAMGISAALFSAGAMAAGSVTLQSVNESNVITVKCGATQATEKTTLFPIKPTSPTVLPDNLIKTFIGSDIYCDFFESTTDIGTAHLTIAGDASTATVASWSALDAAHFGVSLSSPNGVPTTTLKVILTKH